MKIKEYILIFRQIRGSKGCIVISDLSRGCKIATVYGNYTMDDLHKYTKGFDNN